MKSIKGLYKVGPGPSSSHTMGPMYACQHYLEKFPEAIEFEVVLYGSLALTGKGHFTDVIIERTLSPNKVEIIWKKLETKPEHPNAMTITGKNGDIEFETITYFSVGGGTVMVNTLQGTLDPEIYKEKNLEEILNYCKSKNMQLFEYAYLHEDGDFYEYMEKIFDTMVNSVEEGLVSEGFLPGSLKVLRRAKQINEGKVLDPSEERTRKVSSYSIAVSEMNASMGMVVTAPTCGAAGVMPGVLYYLYKDLKFNKKDIINGLVSAAVIGNVIKLNATFSGAEGGCQAEIGSATAMAAAMIAQVKYNDLEVVAKSAAIGLKHCLGLTCDPVGGYVIFPCIERNGIYGNHAFDSVYLASIDDGSIVIPFDTVVKTMYETGKDIKAEYRETSLGGLAKNYQC